MRNLICGNNIIIAFSIYFSWVKIIQTWKRRCSWFLGASIFIAYEIFFCFGFGFHNFRWIHHLVILKICNNSLSLTVVIACIGGTIGPHIWNPELIFCIIAAIILHEWFWFFFWGHSISYFINIGRAIRDFSFGVMLILKA